MTVAERPSSRAIGLLFDERLDHDRLRLKSISDDRALGIFRWLHG